MKPITHVKLSHGEIININHIPKGGHHYEVIKDILWVVPNHQTSHSVYLRATSAGNIIAKGVNETEVDITAPLDFQAYYRWCALTGYKKHDAHTLRVYTKQLGALQQVSNETV